VHCTLGGGYIAQNAQSHLHMYFKVEMRCSYVVVVGFLVAKNKKKELSVCLISLLIRLFTRSDVTVGLV